MRRLFVLMATASVICVSASAMPVVAADPVAPLRIATFRVDATPPLGSPLCDGAVPPVAKVDDPLSARGLVLLTGEQPIVVCAVDWVGIGNAGHQAWRQALADAAGTSVHRVAIHAVHQHDAPGCDFLAEELLAAVGLSGRMFNVEFAQHTIDATAAAVRAAIKRPQTVTHLGLGRATIEQVASNRRILGPDGNVQHVRWSFTADIVARNAPEGLVDPDVRLISFWNGERPVAAVTYYATHPQSYHGKGAVSSDTVGLARAIRERELLDVPLVHFNGASGNVTMGKYFDGTREYRDILASRIADGMRAAWNAVERRPIVGHDVAWRYEPVLLPPSPRMDEEGLRRELAAPAGDVKQRVRAAMDLAWLARSRREQPIDIGCLKLGDAYVMHMPAELFIEYQLAGQRMRPQSFVAMAAYGDYGAGYIGTEISYSQGGYETGIASRVAPSVEQTLLKAMKKLLE
jgi:Neutral/alkaline non-lysosomal ceramidase, N-terminal